MNMIKYFSIFLLIYCLTTQFLFSSDYDSIALEECINLALNNNPYLKVHRGYEEYQKLVIKHRKGNFFPSVETSYGIINSSFYRSDIISSRLDFNYDIMNVTNALNVKSAKKQLQYRKYNTKYYEQHVKLSTTQAFYDAYRIQEMIPLFIAEKNEYTMLLTFAESNNLSEYDRIFIGIEIKELEKQIENLKNDYSRSICYLKNVIGNSEIKIGTLNSNTIFNPISTKLEGAIWDYVERRSDVQAALVLKSNAEVNVKIAYSSLFPRINLGVSSSYYKSLKASEYYTGNEDIRANLYLPIFAGFRRKQEIEIAKNDIKIQENSLEDVRQRAIYEIQNAYQMLNRIENEYLINESVIVDAKKKFDMSVNRYKKGIGNLIEVRDALYKCYESRINQLELLIFYRTSCAYFNWTIGEI